jgi:phosphatidylethanolamine-binding protein (PEBP) family uncharacterized protein
MPKSLLPRLLPFVIASGIPLAVASCSSNNDNSGGSGAGGTGMGATGGSSVAGKGGSGTGGSTGGTGGSTGGTGGSTGGTGGSTGGTGGSATGGTGGSTGGAGGQVTTGGSAGRATAGSSGMGGKGATGGGGASAAGGATSGGAPSGGMGGAHGGAPSGGAPSAGAGGSAGASTGSFVLASTDQMDGAKFDGKFTCNGGMLGAGINPELHWSGTPAGAMSFAITFIDVSIGADQGMGQHYAIYNIPASVMEIAQGALVKTLMGDISMAKQANPLPAGGFLAPCATMDKVAGMDDNYEFTIYALSTATLSGAGTSVASVLQALGVLNGTKLVSPPMLNAAVLGTAVLHGHAGKAGQ